METPAQREIKHSATREEAYQERFGVESAERLETKRKLEDDRICREHERSANTHRNTPGGVKPWLR